MLSDLQTAKTDPETQNEILAMNQEDLESVEAHRRWLQRAWCDRLYEDYDRIAYSFSTKLKRPVIQIRPMVSRWGLWDPLTRTITLAEQLIQQYEWDIVLEILKHEMAHQLVEDHFGADEAHGPCFRRACAMLGVSDWASRSEAELGAPLQTPRTTPLGAENDANERLLKRVEKLLALAGSSNEHEAGQAMQKVQELYTKYNVDRIIEAKGSSLIYLTINSGKKRLERHHYLIGSILNDHFFVKVIYTESYDAGKNTTSKAIECLGTRENILMAEYVYYFLLQQIHSLWETFRKDRKKTVRSKSSYFTGVLTGFRDQLDKNRVRAEAAATVNISGNLLPALRKDDERLDQYVTYRYPKLVKVRTGRTLRDARSYDAGREEGAKLKLHKAITHQEGNRGRLLR